MRQLLLRDYEIAEISLFADKVFRYGDAESAVVVGRRLGQGASRQFPIRYQRIREGQIPEFSRTYTPSSTGKIGSSKLAASTASSLFLPDLNDVWDQLAAMPKLGGVAKIGKGLEHQVNEGYNTTPRRSHEVPD